MQRVSERAAAPRHAAPRRTHVAQRGARAPRAHGGAGAFRGPQARPNARARRARLHGARAAADQPRGARPVAQGAKRGDHAHRLRLPLRLGPSRPLPGRRALRRRDRGVGDAVPGIRAQAQGHSRSDHHTHPPQADGREAPGQPVALCARVPRHAAAAADAVLPVDLADAQRLSLPPALQPVLCRVPARGVPSTRAHRNARNRGRRLGRRRRVERGRVLEVLPRRRVAAAHVVAAERHELLLPRLLQDCEHRVQAARQV